MSDEVQGTSSGESATRMLTAEYKDGQLEIVEVTPYDKHEKIQGHIIEDADGHSNIKYMQVLDSKNMVVDLLNLTLVKCEDGQETYRLVGGEGDDTTVTCVLANDDGDEQESQDNQESYVVLNGDQEPVVFLQSDLQQTNHNKIEAIKEKKPMSPSEILEKAKALQKAKALLTATNSGGIGGGGRKLYGGVFQEQDSQDIQESYVVLDGDQGEPVVFLQSDLQQTNHNKIEAKKEKKPMSPSEILEKAKALQKAKALLTTTNSGGIGGGGRKLYGGVFQEQESQDNQESYVVLDGDQGEPVVFLQSDLQQTNHNKIEAKKEKKPMSPSEILEKAKALQKAKVLLTATNSGGIGGGGRKRRSTLPPPHELLASPQFKLFLYSCKLCSFKCNAIKELSAHKAAEHAAGNAGGAGAGRWRGPGRGSAITLQCARCPYRGITHNQLMKHVKEKHVQNIDTTKIYLDSPEAAEADVLVCGACGFETSERDAFRVHVINEHSH